MLTLSGMILPTTDALMLPLDALQVPLMEQLRYQIESDSTQLHRLTAGLTSDKLEASYLYDEHVDKIID